MIGFDARHNSDVFAEDTAAVWPAPASGPTCCRARCPTPVLAFAVADLGCAAGVMVTASHNPPTRQRLQGVPRRRRADRAAGRRRDLRRDRRRRPRRRHPAGRARRSAHRPPRRAGRSSAYLADVPGVRLVPTATRRAGRLHRDARRRRRGRCWRAFERAGFPPPARRRGAGRARPRLPDRARSRTRRSPARSTCCSTLAGRVERRRRHRQRPRRRPAGRGHPDARGAGGWRRAARRRDRLAARPTTSCATRRATTGSSSPRSCRRRSSARWPRPPASTTPRRFTGFKWIAHAGARPPDAALRVRLRAGARLPRRPSSADKDGITAAVLLAEVAALAKADGVTLQDRLADIDARFGRHVTAERSVPMSPAAMRGLMDALRAGPPAALAGDAGRRHAGLPRRRPPPLPPAAARPGSRSARAAPSPS